MYHLLHLILLLAITLSTCARPPRRADSGSAFTFSADRPISTGNAVNKLCGRCCQDGSYCGQLAEHISLPDESNPSQRRVLEFPKGSNLTCLLRARDVFGAVDGGLCVPSILSVDRLLENFCTTLDQTWQVSYSLTNVMYQAGLTVQPECGTCCDGQHICDAAAVCRPRKDGIGGVCVPENTSETIKCSHDVEMTETLRCESCDEPSPAAQLFEADHKLL